MKDPLLLKGRHRPFIFGITWDVSRYTDPNFSNELIPKNHGAGWKNVYLRLQKMVLAVGCLSLKNLAHLLREHRTWIPCVSFRWLGPPLHHPLTFGEPGSLGYIKFQGWYTFTPNFPMVTSSSKPHPHEVRSFGSYHSDLVMLKATLFFSKLS